MIAHLSGNLHFISPSTITIDCCGVGYSATISLSSYSEFKSQEKVFVYIQEYIREDQYTLYGFSTLYEKNLFNLLLKVNGIGPSSALMILSSMELKEVEKAIRSEDYLQFQKVKGVGMKTAQRIIIDLKDKIMQLEEDQSVGSKPTQVDKNLSNLKADAISALEILGVMNKSALKLLNQTLNENPDVQLEDLIKLILKAN